MLLGDIRGGREPDMTTFLLAFGDGMQHTMHCGGRYMWEPVGDTGTRLSLELF